MNAYLLFGCNGLAASNNYVLCRGVVNPVVDLSKIPPERRPRLEIFLDNACGLFDKPCSDYNKCVNIVNFLYRQFGIITEDMLHNIQAFLKMHKNCGVYIMILLKEDFHEQYKDSFKQ
jgi:hypothetical protein